MATRTATTVWQGTLFEGAGKVTLDSSNVGTYDVSWPARAEQPGGKTSPEELIAAAHSSCFSMALSNALAENGTPATSITTSADVELSLKPAPHISGIKLTTRVVADGLDGETLTKLAQGAKEGCPVSQALTGTTITLDAALG